MKPNPINIACGCLAASLSATALAAGANAAQELDPIQVSASRLRTVPDFEVPASITTVHVNADSNRAQTNITELLAGFPGVTALDRQNYAQDTQLSIRGNGSRATFGVRSLRLYIDGIPASMPDGQGQLSHFNVMGADTVQVLRGPFSALYGNSAGGVVQMWSSPGTTEPTVRARATYGSFDTRTYGIQGLGTTGPVNYNLALSRFETDGFRDHSAARRDSANLRLGVDVGEDRSLTFVANYIDIPEAQDVLGLEPVDWWADPQQTVSVAEQYNTRKSVKQLQGGAIFEQRLGRNTFRATAYTGNRKVTQYLAIPTFPQANPTHSGGVIDLDGDYRGTDLRWSWAGDVAGRPMEFTLGTSYDWQDQHRRGYENFVGSQLGVRGNLRRDENDKVDNTDQYAQAWWHFADRWSVLAGARHSKVKFRSNDHYIVGTNQDDSGSASYSDTTLVGGLMFSATETLRLYASTGDGFETPTFSELAYRTDGQPGLAFDLKPARSHNYEFGAKWRPASGIAFDAAVFRTKTSNELVVARNSGGRSSYFNAPRSRRQGMEASLLVPFAVDWQLAANVTLLDAQFTRSYVACSGIPCVTPNVTIPAGSRIPGAPRQQGMVRLGWTPGPWSTAVEFTASSRIYVNDANSVRTPGYGLWNAEAGYNWKLSGNTLRGFARIENVFDRNYVGSVIVNEGNGRYFESGTDRTYLVGVQWRWL
jgi:iron complex outermembrane receptor protein